MGLVFDGDVVEVLIATVFAMMMCGTLGVGLSGLVANHIAAIVAVGWLFVIDQLLLGLLTSVGRWTPLGQHRRRPHGPRRDHGRALLPAWAAASILVGHATAFAVLGAWATVRADIHEST